MRAVLQRVNYAAVSVAGQVVGEIDQPGLMVLVGVTPDDGPSQAEKVASKIANLRMFNPGGQRGGELSALEIGAPVLVVSQFTLYGDTRKGRRPTWNQAAPGPVAGPLVEEVIANLRSLGIKVASGKFGADMKIRMEADGPYTLLVEA